MNNEMKDIHKMHVIRVFVKQKHIGIVSIEGK